MKVAKQQDFSAKESKLETLLRKQDINPFVKVNIVVLPLIPVKK